MYYINSLSNRNMNNLKTSYCFNKKNGKVIESFLLTKKEVYNIQQMLKQKT